MEIKEVTIKLSEEILRELEKSAKESGKQPEEAAAEMIAASLKARVTAKPAPAFPGVAMIKDSNFLPEAAAEKPAANTRSMFAPASAAGNTTVSPEKLQRRMQLEAQMRELSLLIDTATEDKKETYSLQYAILAAELEATI